VSNYSDNTVSIYLGHGDGSFGGPASYPAGRRPRELTANDFNGDGLKDLIAIDPSSTTTNLSVVLGRGDGTFAPPVISYSRGFSSAESMAIGDFDEDGFLDVVTGSGDSTGRTIFIGRGDGSFDVDVPDDMGVTGGPASVADFNGDGHLDIVGGQGVLLGGGDGTFPGRISFRSSGYTFGDPCATADFDGDGDLDLAVAKRSTASVLILPGRGDGSFVVSTYEEPRDVKTLGAGDFDGDGVLDLVAARGVYADAFILMGRGDGTFRMGERVETGGRVESVVVEDFNSDGFLDFALGYRLDRVAFYQGRGDGTFEPGPTLAMAGLAIEMKAGDFNGDGRPDLAIANKPGGITVLLSDGSGGFPSRTNYAPWARFVALDVGDFDGDGVQDLAGLTEELNSSDQDALVLLGRGDGSFDINFDYRSDHQGQVDLAIGDFDGDGFSDMVLANSSDHAVTVMIRRLRVYPAGAQRYFPAQEEYYVGGRPNSVVVGDFNLDGRLDVAVGVSNYGVTLLMGRGDGTFQARTTYTGGGQLIVADFNGDGRPDLATADVGVRVLLNRAVIERPTVVVQGGMGQRSYVDRASWTFSEAVNVGDLIADGSIVDAVGLYNLGMEPGTSSERRVSLSASQFRYDPATRTLTWELAADSAKQSLPDGAYEWRIDAAAITNAAGRTLATNDGASYTSAFHRLLGDASGDGVVDQVDIALINAASGSRPGSSNWDVDADLDRDGSINVRDRLIVQRAMGGRIVRPSALASRAASLAAPDGLVAVGLAARGTDAADATVSPLRPTSRGGADRRFSTAMRRGSPALALQRSRIAAVRVAGKAAGLARGSSLSDR